MVKTKSRKQKDKPGASSKGPAAKPIGAGTQAPTISFSRINAIYLGAGAVAIGLGFYLLAQGSMTLAPILLVLGYCVLLPIGIIKK
ncbi:MAG: hypothetical protein KAI97_09405 [Gemmatimonadetes bacterium]|nr:hypothetical protein [Gemmatimonadota bacterium]